MNVIKRKLNSRRGASITWALLIFLVCAVVGSAVLVAGTTASGRMSKLAENDQRYYAVNSAVRMLRKTMENETVTVVKEKEEGKDAVISVNGVTVSSEETPSFPSFAAEAAYLLACTESFDGRPEKQLETTITVGTEDDPGTDVTKVVEALSVSISETVQKNGTVLFTVSKGSTGSAYAVEMTFALDRKTQTAIEETADGTQKEIVTSTFLWKLNDIETVSDKPLITTGAFSGTVGG